jgi:hypothetical protein
VREHPCVESPSCCLYSCFRPAHGAEEDAPENIFDFTKYYPTIICNGRVYLATFSDRLNVYGLVPPPASLPSWGRPGDLIR